MTAKKADIADLPAWPRLLSREQAAAYCCLSPNTFDAEVAAGTLPPDKPIFVCDRKVWDRLALDAAIDSGPTGPREDRNVRKARWQSRQNSKANAR